MAEDAAKAGVVIVSELLSLSESDSESLTRIGNSKKEKSFWSSHSSIIGSKLVAWEGVTDNRGPDGSGSHVRVLEEDLFAEGPLDRLSFV